MTTLTEEVRQTLPTRTNHAVRTHVLTETPVLTMPTYEDAEGNPTQRDLTDVLITRLIGLRHGGILAQETQDAWVGRVATVRRSLTEGLGWWVPDLSAYAEGAVLNPAPIDGHYYRIVGGSEQLVKYESATGRWHVLLGRGSEPWYAINDYFSAPPAAYYEVVYSEDVATETPGHPVVSEDIDVEDETGNGFLELARLHDKGKLIDGVVPRVTEFKDGVLYVGYPADVTSQSRETLFFGRKFAGIDELVPQGRWSVRWGGDYEGPSLNDAPLPADLLWGEAHVAPPVIEHYYLTALDVLQARFQERERGFEQFNDALNELATEQDWCHEYERVMGTIGMRSRTADKVRVAVDVTVDLNITDESPSYRITSPIEGEHSLDSVSNVRFDARMSVTVERVVDKDHDYDDGFDSDDADWVDLDAVRDAVENKIGGGIEWEIEEWTVDGDAYESGDQDSLT